MKENATSAAVWMRGLYIIIFGVILYFAFALVWLLVVFQFLTKLFTGELNQQLRRFAAPLSRYVSQILSYITFQSDERPFPFSPWPADGPAKPSAQETRRASAKPDRAKASPAQPPAQPPAQGTRRAAKKKTATDKRAGSPPSRQKQTGGQGKAQPEE